MKLWKRAICAALVGASLTASAAAANVGYLPPKGAQAYLDLLKNVSDQYGITMESQEVGVSEGFYNGLVAARLIDMEGDNIPELYYCYRPWGKPYQQYLYQWKNNSLKKLSLPSEPNYNDGGAGYILYDGKGACIRVVDGDFLAPEGETNTYYGMKNGSLTKLLSYNTNTASDSWVSEQTARITKGLSEVKGSFLYMSNMKNPAASDIGATMRQLESVLNPTAKVSSARVTLDGKTISLGAYTIADSNYFKLRDIAAALNGSKKQFSVAWNDAQKRIDLQAGKPYAMAGGELAALPAGSRTAAATNAAVYLNGRALDLTAYNIAGNNYFKLRDLGKALNCYVGWDQATQTIVLNTAKSYTE